MLPHRPFEYGFQVFSSELVFIIILIIFQCRMVPYLPSTQLRTWNQSIDPGSNNQHQQPDNNNKPNNNRRSDQQLQQYLQIPISTFPSSVPTIPSKALESFKSAYKLLNDPETHANVTTTPRCFFCNPLPTDCSPAPRSYFKSVRQFTALKSRRYSSIIQVHHVPSIPNKALAAHKSICYPLNDPKISSSSLNLRVPTIPNTDLESHSPTYHRASVPTSQRSRIRLWNPTNQNAIVKITSRCFFCNPLPTDFSPAPRSCFNSVRRFTALKSRRSSSIFFNVPTTPTRLWNLTTHKMLPLTTITPRCRFSVPCPLTDLSPHTGRCHEDHNPTTLSPIPL